MTLFDDLKAAQPGPECPLCGLITESTGEEETVLRASVAGTIGVHKLAAIFRANGISIGRRVIERHRREEHKP